MKKLMESVDVYIVRVYMVEPSSLIKSIFEHLEKEVKIRGISLFRAVKGFGETGEHGRWNLPIIIEFFDSEDKVQIALEYLSQFIKTKHIVYWKVNANA